MVYVLISLWQPETSDSDAIKEANDTYGELVAESQILLAIALGHFDRVVDIVNSHAIVGNVLHQARSTATLEIGRERSGSPRPNFDTRTILYNIVRDVIISPAALDLPMR